METRNYGLTKSSWEQSKERTGVRGPRGIFADVSAVRAVHPNDTPCLACEWLINDVTGTYSLTRLSKNAARGRQAPAKRVSTYSFSCFSSGEKKVQLGTHHNLTRPA
jgi:hypothetical protein